MPVESTGKVDFKVGSETYQTWYKVYGDLKNSQKPPVVTLHGGPGMSHHHMLPHKALYEQEGIPVVVYDQIGNGASSHCAGVPKEFWTPELFMDELDNILQALGIRNNFDLLGHSWGGMLGAQYAATRSPKGLKRLIISNSPASIQLMVEGIELLLNEFPAELLQTLRRHEAAGTYEDKEYQDAMQVFFKKHTCTLDPWPEEVNATFASIAANPTVRHATIGPSIVNVSGNLKGWSIIDILHKISYPTLLISAQQDAMVENAILPYFLNIPKVKWVEFQNSTHFPALEEPERYFHILLNFLKGSQ